MNHLAAQWEEVHIWRVSLNRVAPEAMAVLSPDERARAARFHFERDSRRFIAARGTLRLILGRYLGRQPDEIEFRYGPQGKPDIPGTDLRFNLSHSHDTALIAVTLGREVGVDIERERPGVAAEGIADYYFSRREAAALRALPEDERDAAFFRCWTRKEAYIKACGGGLSIPLASFDVSLDPKRAEFLRTEDSERWTIRRVDAGQGYAAAVVVEGEIAEIRLRDWR